MQNETNFSSSCNFMYVRSLAQDVRERRHGVWPFSTKQFAVAKAEGICWATLSLGLAFLSPSDQPSLR